MIKPKSTPKKRVMELTAARRAGGNQKQSHWLDRLEAVMKQRAEAEKKARKKVG